MILHLYEEKNERCVDDLQGMFAFAIWDRKRRKLFIARDRVGMKPLYYTVQGEELAFASELKALLETPFSSSRADPGALLHYLTFLYIPSPLSIFSGVKKLPPAHCLVWKNGEVSVYRYWSLSEAPGSPSRSRASTGRAQNGCPGRKAVDIEEMVFERVRETVASHLVSDAPLGVFLSGGMDSGALVGLMAGMTDEPVRTFSIGYGPKTSSFNELELSRLLASRFKTEHHEYILEPDVTKLLPEIVWHLDEPFADSSAIPSYLVSQAASAHVKVALSGIGGDELFGGYPRYLGAMLAQQYEKLPAGVRRVAARLASGIPESVSSQNQPGRLKRFLEGAARGRREGYLHWVTFLSGEEAKSLLSPDFASLIEATSPTSRHLSLLEGETDDWPGMAQQMDIMTYLPDDLLMMGDKMSMAHGLEVRVPFCDHLLVRDMMTIPSSEKLEGFKLKSLMKRAFKRLLPAEIISHRKQGFMVPLAVWLKEDLRGLTEDLLSVERIRRRGYFRPEQVRLILDSHYSGKRNLTDLIYAMPVLELWQQVYVD